MATTAGMASNGEVTSVSLTHTVDLRWQVHLGEGLLLRIFVVAKVFGFGEKKFDGITQDSL